MYGSWRISDVGIWSDVDLLTLKPAGLAHAPPCVHCLDKLLDAIIL